MAGTHLIEAGDYVDIDIGNNSERYVVLADGISPTQVYISPANNLSIRSSLVYINGEWKVQNAENINYKITFFKGGLQLRRQSHQSLVLHHLWISD